MGSYSVRTRVSIFGHTTPLQLTDFPVAVLYILAIASIGIYGVVLSGWASGSTYPLLGGLRSSAQMISYEIAMGLSFVAVFLFAGTMSTSSIVNGQTDLWFGLLVLPSFLIYATAMVGETNRAPFDLPEAESELVGGFHTEYSTMKFALFFLAEYINMVTVSAVAVTLFLGGWRAPWPISIWSGANEGWYPMIWFFLKVFIFIFIFIWLRYVASLPLRPVHAIWLEGPDPDLRIVDLDHRHHPGCQPGAGLTPTPFHYRWNHPPVAVLWILGQMSKRRAKNLAENVIPEKFKPNRGGFPVPPLPGQEYRPARRTVVADVGSNNRRRWIKDDFVRGGARWLNYLKPYAASRRPSSPCFRKVNTEQYPKTRTSTRPSPPSTVVINSTASRWAGKVRGLRAVQCLGLPSRCDLRRRCGQRRGRASLTGRALRRGLPNQLPSLHSVWALH